MKAGFVAIIGRPNVGKSTFLNRVLGEKVAIATAKPQTTRNAIKGIHTIKNDRDEPEAQIIFIDTPGIHKARNKLGEAMDRSAFQALQDVDLILFMVDGTLPRGKGDTFVLDTIRGLSAPIFLLINKIDEADPAVFKEGYDYYEGTGLFEGIYGISAKDGTHVDELVGQMVAKLPEGPLFFPEDMITDHPEKFLVSEIIREKILLYLDEEVPHGVAVEIESFEEGDQLTRIGAVIYCEKKSHKGILIGKGGKKLKGIGRSARLDIEALLACKVYLNLWVKVRENWRDSEREVRRFGYRED